MTYEAATPSRSRIDDIIFLHCVFPARKFLIEKENGQLWKGALGDIVVYFIVVRSLRWSSVFQCPWFGAKIGPGSAHPNVMAASVK